MVKCPWMWRLTGTVVRRLAYSVTINWRSLASNASLSAFSSTSSWCWQQSTYWDDFNWDGCIHDRLTGVMGSAFWLLVVVFLLLLRLVKSGLTNLVMGEVTFLVMRRSFWLNVWDTIFRDCELRRVSWERERWMRVFTQRSRKRMDSLWLEPAPFYTDWGGTRGSSHFSYPSLFGSWQVCGRSRTLGRPFFSPIV